MGLFKVRVADFEWIGGVKADLAERLDFTRRHVASGTKLMIPAAPAAISMDVPFIGKFIRRLLKG